MVTYLYRLIVAGVLAALSCLLGGCVLAQLTAGFTLTPPGGYVSATFADTSGHATTLAVTTSQPGPATAPATEPAP